MSTPFHLDKEKYLQLLKTEGSTAALTQLHQDLIRWEVESFEGEKGYQPDLWNALEDVRTFSRQIWDSTLEG